MAFRRVSFKNQLEIASSIANWIIFFFSFKFRNLKIKNEIIFYFVPAQMIKCKLDLNWTGWETAKNKTPITITSHDLTIFLRISFVSNINSIIKNLLANTRWQEQWFFYTLKWSEWNGVIVDIYLIFDTLSFWWHDSQPMECLKFRHCTEIRFVIYVGANKTKISWATVIYCSHITCSISIIATKKYKKRKKLKRSWNGCWCFQIVFLRH